MNRFRWVAVISIAVNCVTISLLIFLQLHGGSQGADWVFHQIDSALEEKRSKAPYAVIDKRFFLYRDPVDDATAMLKRYYPGMPAQALSQQREVYLNQVLLIRDGMEKNVFAESDFESYLMYHVRNALVEYYMIRNVLPEIKADPDERLIAEFIGRYGKDFEKMGLDENEIRENARQKMYMDMYRSKAISKQRDILDRLKMKHEIIIRGGDGE